MTFDSDSAAMLNDGICTLISSYLKTKSAEAGDCTVTCDVAAAAPGVARGGDFAARLPGGAAPWTGRQRFEISFATAAGTTKFPFMRT